MKTQSTLKTTNRTQAGKSRNRPKTGKPLYFTDESRKSRKRAKYKAIEPRQTKRTKINEQRQHGKSRTETQDGQQATPQAENRQTTQTNTSRNEERTPEKLESIRTQRRKAGNGKSRKNGNGRTIPKAGNPNKATPRPKGRTHQGRTTPKEQTPEESTKGANRPKEPSGKAASDQPPKICKEPKQENGKRTHKSRF